MTDVQQTPPGGWPRGKSKDSGDSEYFDDDTTTLRGSKDVDTTDSTSKPKKKLDDSSQDEADVGKTVKSKTTKATKGSDSGAEKTAKSAKSKVDSDAEKTTKSAKSKVDKSKADKDSDVEKTTKSAKSKVDSDVEKTTKSAKSKVASDSPAKTTKSDKSKSDSSPAKGDSDSTDEDENDPMADFKAGLKGGKDDSKYKGSKPEPFELTEEEKQKLTPKGDISNVTKAAEAAKSKSGDAKSKTDGAKSKTDDTSKTDDAKDSIKGATGKASKTDLPESDTAKDGVKDATGKDASTKDLPEGDAPDVEGTADDAKADATDAADGAKADAEDATSGSKTDLADGAKEGADAADGAKKDLPEGEEAATDEAGKEVETPEAPEGAEVPKEGEEALKDGEAPEGAEVPKEGEEALKEGEEKSDEAVKEGEETSEEKLQEGEETSEEKLQEGEEAAGEAAEEALDLSILKGAKVNKGGNLISEDNKLVGRVKEGVLVHLVGKRCDENGVIWSDSGKKLGVAELIPEDEREGMGKEAAPFEAFPDAKVDGEGYVVSGEERVGKVVEGDIKKLRNMKVDADGDILDRQGSVAGRAERWEPEVEPEAEPEPEKDRSILAGKRVNKAGNLVDSHGALFGRVVEGDVKRMIGRMSDAKGIIRSESGDELGRAEVIPEGEREGAKEGPFAELSGCTVRKDGKIVTAGNEVVGRLTSGDPKVLAGREVDDEGEIVDKNGNVIGKAERWEEPEEEAKPAGPLAGRKVNKEGLVTDSDGNVIAKLTSGDLSVCAGKEIDDDNDVVVKGQVVGHVTMLGDIKEPEESADDKAKREKGDSDKKLAQQMSYCLTQCLDKIKPICQMITSKIEKAERTPKEELDEEELVRDVRPLIEEGGKILQEANGIIRGLDPDGRIQANAKHKTATHEATPEEYHLADILKELTGTVTKTIDNAKKKIEGMPHAKKELSPLWGLLSEPLFQILAAVGLLLNGVLGLVGRLLSGLGLGGIVDSLLGGLGVKNILEALGVGSLTDSLTGKKKGDKKKSGGGGLLGLGG